MPAETPTVTVADRQRDLPAADLLDHAADIVEHAWCKGSNARRADGAACTAHDPAAATWCALGSMSCAALRMGLAHVVHLGCDTRLEWIGPHRTDLIEHARRAILRAVRRDATDNALSDWNDRTARTGAAVARAMRAAASTLRATAASHGEARQWTTP